MKTKKSSSTPVIPVIMCTWRRIKNLPGTIKTLQHQKDCTVHLYIWNNNPEIASEIDSIVKKANLKITVMHSDTNVGGFGRFYYAEKLVNNYRYLLFIDDDQRLDEYALITLWNEARPRTVSGQWAYNFITSNSYWLRLPAKRGREAVYVGTCGMITDSSIFKDKRLFQCPKQFWFIEDLWFSYFAHHVYKWRLIRSQAQFWFLPDEKNQFIGLMREKSQFLRYLKAKGWHFRQPLVHFDLV